MFLKHCQRCGFLKEGIMNQKNTDFFEKVYELVRQIPYGRVTTYGLIANALGAKKSARMVGWALNASHGKEDVPAHRVVNRNGILTGKFHFQGTNLMQQLLESEGITVENNQVVDFEEYLWQPETENFVED